MPRMTNTFMLGGKDDPGEICRASKNGIYAKSFGGGQVDITSGKFVFSCTEAYLIENGKLGAPIKGATLIGDGPTVLTKVAAIGNDMALDEGIGICGKGGQSVPAGVGQPTLLIDGTDRRRHRGLSKRAVAVFTDALTDDHVAFIARQKVFFVATAAEGARINLSPKGYEFVPRASVRTASPGSISAVRATRPRPISMPTAESRSCSARSTIRR